MNLNLLCIDSKYKAKLIESQGEMDKFLFTVEDFLMLFFQIKLSKVRI